MSDSSSVEFGSRGGLSRGSGGVGFGGIEDGDFLCQQRGHHISARGAT